MNATVIQEEKQHFINDFERLENESPPEWLQQLRRKALDHFRLLKFPTTRDEDWRFTNIAQLVKHPFRTLQEPTELRVEFGEIEPFLFGDNVRLVFVNGRLSQELSSIHVLPKGVKVGTFLEQELVNSVKGYLAHYARYDRNIFTALNTALMNEGAVVIIPEGTIVENPIQIIFITVASSDIAHHPRILVVAGKQSIANIVESHIGLDDSQYFSNSVAEIILGEGSIVEHHKVQKESDRAFHIAASQVYQMRDSNYGSLNLTLGAQISRNELNVLLDGVGANCTLNGLYVIGQGQHTDHQTSIDHAKPNGTSQELYKGILNGSSRAVFNGKIMVRKDAQRTDARQTNKNLLLSEGSRVNTKPQLEILADDVKCTHGATIGHLEEDALFYLKSRGMDDQSARSLLMYGFINDVLSRIKVESVRKKLEHSLQNKLQEFARNEKRPS